MGIALKAETVNYRSHPMLFQFLLSSGCFTFIIVVFERMHPSARPPVERVRFFVLVTLGNVLFHVWQRVVWYCCGKLVYAGPSCLTTCPLF